jgi:hypothetical protein
MSAGLCWVTICAGLWAGWLSVPERVGWSVSDHLGACAYLTLRAIRGKLALARSANARPAEGKKMTSATTKQVKSEDVANKALAQELGATINEGAFRAWFDKSAEMVLAGSLSTRGWSATVDACEGSTFAKSSWRSYVVAAYNLGSIKGGDKVNVRKLITTTQDALRVMTKAEFKDNLEVARSFADFVKIVEALGEDKPAKTRGAGKEVASEKDINDQVKAVAVDFDAVVTLALGLFQELEGEKALVHNFDNAEKLGRLIKAQIANSRALSVAHPVKASA